MADIENVGSEAQTNVNLNFTMEDDGGDVVFTEDLSYGTITAHSLAETFPFVGSARLPWVPIRAPMRFPRTPPMKIRPTTSFPLNSWSTTLFRQGSRRVLQPPRRQQLGRGRAPSWAYGNYFYIPNANGDYFRYVFFSLETPAALAGENVTVSIYKSGR